MEKEKKKLADLFKRPDTLLLVITYHDEDTSDPFDRDGGEREREKG